MNHRFRFRTVVILALLGLPVLTSIVASVGLGWALVDQRSKGVLEKTRDQALALAHRAESLLETVEESAPPLLEASRYRNGRDLSAILQAAAEHASLIRAYSLIDSRGIAIAIGLTGADSSKLDDLLGIDYSYNRLYRQALRTEGPVWSDKFVSAFTATTSLGMAYREGDRVLLAELGLNALQLVIDRMADPGSRVWVVDRRGELVVDTTTENASGALNVGTIPFVKQALSGPGIAEFTTVNGRPVALASAQSRALGWTFFVVAPSGWNDPEVQRIVTVQAILFLVFFGLTLMVAPFLGSVLTKEVASLKALANQLANGLPPLSTGRHWIHEIDELAGFLSVMSDQVQRRERALRETNQRLETRVEERTESLSASNRELRDSLDQNRRMQDSLVEAAKLAALGRLVAGVAHELNTPLGTAQTALSALEESHANLQAEAEAGLRRSTLDQFLDRGNEALALVHTGLYRAAELVAHFRRAATAESYSQRVTFQPGPLIQEVVSAIRSSPAAENIHWDCQIDETITAQSHPTVLVQVVTELLENAVDHAWPEGPKGTVHVQVERHGDQIQTTVDDDGVGIPPDSVKAVFEPFFTTQIGKGKVGLGLHIAFNAAQVPLGGDLALMPRPGSGCRFVLRIPLIAPT